MKSSQETQQMRELLPKRKDNRTNPKEGFKKVKILNIQKKWNPTKQE